MKEESDFGTREDRDETAAENRQLSELVEQVDCLQLCRSPQNSVATVKEENTSFWGQGPRSVSNNEEISIIEADGDILGSSKPTEDKARQEEISNFMDSRVWKVEQKRRKKEEIIKINQEKERLLGEMEKLDKDLEVLDKAILERMMEEHRKKMGEKVRKNPK